MSWNNWCNQENISRISVKLNTRQDVQEFCSMASKIQSLVSVSDKDGFVGNAKSLIGVLRLNIKQPLTVEVVTEDYEKAKLYFKSFLV